MRVRGSCNRSILCCVRTAATLLFIYFWLHTNTFQLLDKPWSQVSSLLPPVLVFNFYRAQGSAIPLLVDFSSSVANSRSRAFRKSICAQEKIPGIDTSMRSGGLELAKLTYCTRLEHNLIRHRGDRLYICAQFVLNYSRSLIVLFFLRRPGQLRLVYFFPARLLSCDLCREVCAAGKAEALRKKGTPLVVLVLDFVLVFRQLPAFWPPSVPVVKDVRRILNSNLTYFCIFASFWSFRLQYYRLVCIAGYIFFAGALLPPFFERCRAASAAVSINSNKRWMSDEILRLVLF